MAQPSPTIRETLGIRIDRLRERKRRGMDDAAACQAQIDALKAELDALTPEDEITLGRLQQLDVIKAKD